MVCSVRPLLWTDLLRNRTTTGVLAVLSTQNEELLSLELLRAYLVHPFAFYEGWRGFRARVGRLYLFNVGGCSNVVSLSSECITCRCVDFCGNPTH